MYLIVTIGVLGFIVSYGVLLRLTYLPKMLNIKDPVNFHIKAYRDKRPAEFQMFNRALEENDFSFHGLYDYVTGILTYQEVEFKAIKSLLEDFDKRREEYKLRINHLDEKHQSAIKEYDSYIKSLHTEIIQQEELTHYLTDFLAEVNVIIFRIL